MGTGGHRAPSRAAFLDADYTYDGVLGAIGEEAHRALGRNSALAGGAGAGRAGRPAGGAHPAVAAATAPSPRPALEHGPCPGLVEPLVAAGVLAIDGDQVRARLDLRPYAADDEPIWILSDLTPGLDTVLRPIRPDFVLGRVLGLSHAGAAHHPPPGRLGARPRHRLRRPVGSPGPARRTHRGDRLNPRALRLARATLALNRVEADLRLGSLYGPVAGERFDLVISNPPYVMSPPARTQDRLVYREGDQEADGLVEHLVRRRSRRPRRRRHPAAAGQLGPRRTARTGPSGWPGGSSRPAATPTWSSARCWTSPRTPSCGSPTRAGPAAPDYLERYGDVARLLRPARRHGGGPGLDRPPADRARPATDPDRGLAVRGGAADRPGLRRPSRPRSQLDERLSDADVLASCRGGWRRTWSPRPGASRAPPIRSTSSTGSSAGSGGRSNWTPPWPACSVPATVSCRCSG